MLGNMTEELSRKTLKNYVKLGERMGLWSSLDQTYIDSKGMTGRRIIVDWNISSEEYNGNTD